MDHREINYNVLIKLKVQSHTVPMVIFPPLLQELRGYPQSVIGIILAMRGLGTFVGFAIIAFTGRVDPRIILHEVEGAYANHDRVDANEENYNRVSPLKEAPKSCLIHGHHMHACNIFRTCMHLLRHLANADHRFVSSSKLFFVLPRTIAAPNLTTS